ncbi:siderophore-interacting protein [Streptomyces sp. NBC_00859]|uniref:siderophore-interacting protein n=1 Tax=Streptomyces sp. NBC_00859 TaxID=2903682 RepID=UPI003863A8C2|nr:siderophore-interacting protein [Streptomyces sp. NBC_00859]
MPQHPAGRCQVGTKHVESVHQLTPRRRRVVLGGIDLENLHFSPYTDQYLMLLFAPTGITYREPFGLDHIKAAYPNEH